MASRGVLAIKGLGLSDEEGTVEPPSYQSFERQSRRLLRGHLSRPMRRFLSLTLLLLLPLASCVTVGDGKRGQKSNIGPWVEASPQLQMKIDQEVQRLPWTHGIERIEMIQWFANLGEPAYAVLLEMAQDERSDVAGAALAALGATHDARLVEPLRELPWPSLERSDLALERARTLLRLGDWTMVPHLIGGLHDDRVMIRALCSQALYEATHERFDYDANGSEFDRERSAARWLEWWNKRQGDALRQ
ncbi:MAG: hypothetical protein ACI8X5_000422 [Planctomycetota bacterium]|jgi:hypothetical protein